jgi:subfamily B ATP-binding cassette protein MsbA
MTLSFKSNFRGYFNFYYRIVGNRLLLYLGLSIFISFLDGMGLAMFIPLLQAVDKGSTAGSESLGQLHYLTDMMQELGMELNVNTVLGLMMGMFIFKGLLKYVQLTYYARIRHYFIKRVRYALVNNLQGLSYSAFVKMDAGKIQNTLTGEVSRLFLTMTFYFNSAQTFVMLSTYILLAFLANYQFAILVGLGAMLSNGIFRRIFKITKKTSIELSSKGSDFNSFLVQAVHYFKYLKSTNTFASYAGKLKNVINESEYLNRKIGYMKALALSVKEPIIVCIVCLVILIQLTWLDANLSTILLSLLLFYRALSSLLSLQTDWHGFIENIGGLNSVAFMTEQMSSAQEKQGDKDFTSVQKYIHIRDVVFSYDRKKALDHITIKIPAKNTIALVGGSGSGKTTIANMIAGLILPESGDIFIDEVSLRELNLNNYRDKVGYISQEAVIFNDTLYNNITFWAEPTTENVRRFHKAVEMASLKEFVASQPDKEQTMLGDNGILISGGQKQRISIARELYKDADILIFDEATSSLDSETEKMIQENIEKLHGRYTMIVIAHRLSTIKEADIIFLLDKGRITESGSFEDMMLKSSRFKKMVSLQEV